MSVVPRSGGATIALSADFGGEGWVRRPRRSASSPRPVLLVEVLSPSTEAYDRGEKLAHCQTIAALREVVLVAHNRREVVVVRREADQTWSQNVYRDVVKLASLDDCERPIAEVYRDPLVGP